MLKTGTWVLIESVVLSASERADNLPEDTKKTDMIKWVKGRLMNDAEMGETAKIKTVTGRVEEGRLVEEGPAYEVNYGGFVPELLQIRGQVKEMLYGGDAE